MRLHGRCRIVECVSVLGGLVLQLALIAQCAGAAVAKESIAIKSNILIFFYKITRDLPVVSDELNVMPIVAGLDAVDADCVPIRGVTCAASEIFWIHKSVK